ncbi:hypothetical protein DVH05_008661 [Phytophthora capsici]|nr:hypothetical protein DVH05_008661 [Phytophthora capsici]
MHFMAISPREEFSPPSLAVTQLSSRTLKSGKSIMEWTGPRPQYQFSFPPQSQAWQRYDDEEEEQEEEVPGHSMLQPQRYATNNISPPPRPISAIKTELPSMFGSDGNTGVTLQPLGSLSMPQLEESTEFQPFCLPQNPAFSDLATLPPCIQPNSVDLQRQLYAQLDTQFNSQFPEYVAESATRYQVPTLFPLKKTGMDNFSDGRETVAIDSNSPLPMTSEAGASQLPEYTTELTNRCTVPTLFPLKQPGMSSFTEEEKPRGDRQVTQHRAFRLQDRVVMPTIQEPKLSPDKRKLCCVEGCKSQARAFNRCKRHGGSKRCSSPGCTKSVQSRGLCIRHGGGSRCQESGCTRASQSQGRCKMHGGGRPCIVAGCDKKAHLKRLCRKHGGGTKCCMVGCDKWAQRQGMCMTHSKEIGMASNEIGAMTSHLQPISPGSSPPLRFFSDAV